MVSVLTVIGIIGVAFAFSLYLETHQASQYVATTQARYLTEAGVAYARALLDEDKAGSRVDALTESWAQATKGSDADADRDGTAESQWSQVTDVAQQPLGRYAVVVTDESGKANLNAARATDLDADPPALDLTKILDAAKIPQAAAVALKIEQYRYGPDGRPGVAGVDDDGDGAIDEPDEYQPLALRGDDRRIEHLEDLAAIAGLTSQQLAHLSRLATVYTQDLNVSVAGKPRLNINTATANELLSVFLDVGLANPWQAAVNVADAVDPDLGLSRVTKSSTQEFLTNQGTLGSWTWDPADSYTSSQPDGAPLLWSVPVSPGTYHILAHGLAGMKVGDVTVNGQLRPSVDHGESLGVFQLAGNVDLQVRHREPAGTTCAFRGIELVLDQPQGGVPVRGIEPVRFNELMVKASLDLPVSSAAFEQQASGWGCPVGSSVCSNGGVGQARWTWTSNLLPPGRYYVRVFGSAVGQTVGEVRVENTTDLLVHGQRHPATLLVGSDGKVSLAIGKTNTSGTYYFQSVTLSLEPDAEYVELINLSDQDIDLSGWVIEGELAGGRSATFPVGARIKAHNFLVAAVDLDDAQQGLENNGIDARTAWGLPASASQVQLQFPAGAPSADDDWLKTSPPAGGPTRLILRNQADVVDEIEYPLPPPLTANFQSLEKGDPSVITDQDGDGVDDGWFPSLRLYTPGANNDNNGMKEVVGADVITHDPTMEITVRNRPLITIGELVGLPSGEAWKPFASRDLARAVDRFTVDGLRLEAEGRLTVGGPMWQEKTDGYEYNHTTQPPTPGAWQWTSLPDGPYRLSLYGWAGERLSIHWQYEDGHWSPWSPQLTMDAGGRIAAGQVRVGPAPAGSAEPGTPSGTLTLEITCATLSGICHLDYVRLDPRLVRVGPVNINTGPTDVLRAVPQMTDARISRLLAGRPYGDQQEKGRGIGDLLLGTTLGTTDTEKLAVFKAVGHLITVHSDVFRIDGVGQAMDHGHVRATQRITTVVER